MKSKIAFATYNPVGKLNSFVKWMKRETSKSSKFSKNGPRYHNYSVKSKPYPNNKSPLSKKVSPQTPSNFKNCTKIYPLRPNHMWINSNFMQKNLKLILSRAAFKNNKKLLNFYKTLSSPRLTLTQEIIKSKKISQFYLPKL